MTDLPRLDPERIADARRKTDILVETLIDISGSAHAGGWLVIVGALVGSVAKVSQNPQVAMDAMMAIARVVVEDRAN